MTGNRDVPSLLLPFQRVQFNPPEEEFGPLGLEEESTFLE